MKQRTHDKQFQPRLFVRPMAILRLALTGCIVFTSFPAAAQDLQALLNRIERLERDIRTLNMQIARGDDAVAATGGNSGLISSSGMLSGSGVARIDARISSLENDLRDATNAMENLDHRVFEMSGKLDKLISDVDFRLSELESRGDMSTMVSKQVGGVGAANSGTVPQVTPVDSVAEVTQVASQTSTGVLGTITEAELQRISGQPDPGRQQTANTAVSETTQPATSRQQVVDAVAAAPTAPAVQEALSPQDQYARAFGLLRQAKYDAAAIALQTFVNQHPDDSLAPNARYWLGETFYVRSEFVRAAEIFFEGYKVSPDGPKAPDTLLKLGMSLGNLGKNAEACAAFAKLSGEFTDLSATMRSTLDREHLRNGCS